MNVKERMVEVALVFAALVWRGFGLFLFVIGSSAAMGAMVAGSIWTGVLIAWGTLMLGIVGALGYAIATTGKASRKTVHDAANDAVKKFQEDTKKDK